MDRRGKIKKEKNSDWFLLFFSYFWLLSSEIKSEIWGKKARINFWVSLILFHRSTIKKQKWKWRWEWWDDLRLSWQSASEQFCNLTEKNAASSCLFSVLTELNLNFVKLASACCFTISFCRAVFSAEQAASFAPSSTFSFVSFMLSVLSLLNSSSNFCTIHEESAIVQCRVGYSHLLEKPYGKNELLRVFLLSCRAF